MEENNNQVPLVAVTEGDKDGYAKKPVADKTGKENSAKNQTVPFTKKKKNEGPPMQEDKKLVHDQATLALEALEKTLKDDPDGLKVAKKHIAYGLRTIDSEKRGWMTRGMDCNEMHHSAMKRLEELNAAKAAAAADPSSLEKDAAEAIKMLEKKLLLNPNELASTKAHIVDALQRAKEAKTSWMVTLGKMNPIVMYQHAMKFGSIHYIQDGHKKVAHDQATLALEALEKTLKDDPAGLEAAKEYIVNRLRTIDARKKGWMTRGMECNEMHRMAIKHLENKRASSAADMISLEEDAAEAIKMLEKNQAPLVAAEGEQDDHAKKPVANKTGKEISAKNQTDPSTKKKKKKYYGRPTQKNMRLVRKQAKLALEALEETLKNDPAGLEMAQEHIANGLRKFHSYGKKSWMTKGMDCNEMLLIAMEHVKKVQKRAARVADMSSLEKDAAEAIKMLEKNLADDPDKLASTKAYITGALQHVKEGRNIWMVLRDEVNPEIMYQSAMKYHERNQQKEVRDALKEGGKEMRDDVETNK